MPYRNYDVYEFGGKVYHAARREILIAPSHFAKRKDVFLRYLDGVLAMLRSDLARVYDDANKTEEPESDEE